jgi:hypothetical protein
LIHATCVAIGGRGVLLRGRPGSGKSDLALRLIDRGALLVSDDYSCLAAREGRLVASPPGNIAGRIEVRGVGILPMHILGEAPVCLLADLDAAPDRLPQIGTQELQGIAVPYLPLAALEPSAPIKLELALLHFGLAAP